MAAAISQKQLEEIMSVAQLRHVSKTYHLDAADFKALSDINLEIKADRFTVISGPSGSGKTTLLNLIGCIDKPDQGEIVVVGEKVLHLNDNALSDFRARHLGFIFQNFNLLPVLSVFENVEYPLIMSKMPAARRRERVSSLLEAVGLADKRNHRPGQLSGGQRQRVAIARALATSPAIVLADEPTANLDSKTGASIISLMRDMQREFHVTFVFSSHDPQIIAAADDTITIHDGQVVGMTTKSDNVGVAA
jgi:putative ABC transport system ATP-binding protein